MLPVHGFISHLWSQNEALTEASVQQKLQEVKLNSKKDIKSENLRSY